MSLVKEILEEFLKPSLSYKGMQVNLFGIPRFKQHSPASLRTTVWSMKKNGLIEKRDNKWYATRAGKKFVQRKFESLEQFSNKFEKDAPRNLLVMYDIPESKKAEREWFRWHLKKFGYKMIQRSVWVGPSPLPKEFLNYLQKIKLKSTIKTFKLSRTYKNSS